MWASGRSALLRRGRHIAAGVAGASAVAGPPPPAAAAASRTGPPSAGAAAGAGPDAPTRTLWEQLMRAPPFSMEGSRYDQSTYAGRALHFIDQVGDVTTLATACARLERAIAASLARLTLWRARVAAMRSFASTRRCSRDTLRATSRAPTPTRASGVRARS